jgi:hypothetical protein
MASESNVPTPGEPDIVRLVRWAYGYIIAEAAVIRAAKLSIGIMAGIITAAVYVGLEGYHVREDKIRDAIIQLQGEQLAEFRNKLQVKTPDEAANKISELEKKLKPILDDMSRPQRQLTEEQRRKLIHYLEPEKGKLADYWVYISSTEDRESQIYSADILHALRGAQLRVTYLGSGFAERGEFGVIVQLLDPDHPTEFAKTVLDAMSKAGINYST